MTDILRQLCALNATSGSEDSVRDFIISKLPENAEYKISPLGNLTVNVKGRQTPASKVMMAAHMDEVGFIATYITSDGLIKFSAVGGILPQVIYGRQVVFQNGTRGVVGGKPIHLLDDDEMYKVPKINDMYIDIGAADDKEAKSLVSPGDLAYFTGEFTELGDGHIKSKAIDDRAGCAVLLDIINRDLPYDLTCVFTVQEEIGARGAATAAYEVKPDYALITEATTACDIPDCKEEKRVCELSKGCVVSYMDKGTVYNRELFDMCFETAREHDIPVQTKTVIAGGNDSGTIHKAVGGIRTAALSVPCRYLHSPACVINSDDLYATARLMYEVYIKLCEKA